MRTRTSISPAALAVFAFAFALGGCGTDGDRNSAPPSLLATIPVDSSPPTKTEAAPTVARVESEAIGDRRFEINVPAGYDESRPVSLVVVLHGYTGTGSGAKAYFQLEAEARKRGFLTVYPDGTKDGSGNQFWNATDACCQFTPSEADDSTYLTALIDRVEEKFSVDPKRVFFVGHSNGGFMSYRMACEHADRIAAIVSVAGATFDDVSACKPVQPVSIVQVHGTSDGVINFAGGSILGRSYPAALRSVTLWAAYNGCDAATQPGVGGRQLDLDDAVSGNDSSITAVAGCAPGVAVELWTIEGGSHEPKLTAAFASSIMDILIAHPKP